ncbi:hypothetical protein PM082_003920 [Marasmius tenuissimus]|nr:hypothetical protein PM082_003920 [Marasmius tenuissimus]
MVRVNPESEPQFGPDSAESSDKLDSACRTVQKQPTADERIILLSITHEDQDGNGQDSVFYVVSGRPNEPLGTAFIDLRSGWKEVEHGVQDGSLGHSGGYAFVSFWASLAGNPVLSCSPKR